MISEAIEVDRNLDDSGIIQNLFFISNYFWMPLWVDPSKGALCSFFQNCLAHKFFASARVRSAVSKHPAWICHFSFQWFFSVATALF